MAEKLPTKKILIFGLDSHFKEQKKDEKIITAKLKNQTFGQMDINAWNYMINKDDEIHK